MVRKIILPVLWVLVLFPAFQASAGAVPVSEHYFVDEYIAMRDYHAQVGKVFQEDPHDKNLLSFSLNMLKNDLAAFEKMTPPESYTEMKTRVVAGIQAHVKALQLAVQDKPGAMKLWKRGDGDLQWVDAFLMQRDWRIDNIPLVDAGFTPKEAQLTNAQYADRYFLIRLMNRKLGAELLAGKKGGAGLDHTERTLGAQIDAWKATRYPKEMQSIHDQVLRSLEMCQAWVALVKAGKTADAAKKQGEITALWTQIDRELADKYKIHAPDLTGGSL